MHSWTVKLKKLKGIPLDVAVKKVAVKLHETATTLVRRQRTRWMPVRLDSRSFRDFRSLAAHWIDPDRRSEYTEFLRSARLDQEIIRDADRICAHVFNLLGSGACCLGEEIAWNRDFKSGHTWPNRFYKDIPIIDLHNDADVKVPWELSRFQHVFTLGKAYWLSNDEKYALEFAHEIDHWTKHNPIEMSVNWACTMDVAIRAVNWISGFYFFRGSPSIGPDFWERFHASLYLHGQFIFRNLENKGDHTGNHYLANVVGLIGLGIYFGDFRTRRNELLGNNHPQGWLAFGVQELEREMAVQVNEDGTHYEATTSYHRLVTEMFLLTTILCSKNRIRLWHRYMQSLEKMCEFMMHTMKPNGLTPLFGDADDGRLFLFSRYASWVRNDFRHILAVSGEFFDRDDFRYYGRNHQEDALWAVGTVKRKVGAPIERLASVAYRNGGYYVLRNDRIYCLIRCGELSFHGHGTHSHNDQLSFELQVDGQDVIVDPGSYTYTSNYVLRNEFRSTAVHSTVQVGGGEQNDFDPLELFRMKEQTFAVCECFDSRQFIGSHQGYMRKSGIVHRRQFILHDDRLEIVDTFIPTMTDEDAGTLHWESNLPLAPGIGCESIGNTALLRNKERVLVEAIADSPTPFSIHSGKVSSAYGTYEPAQTLRIPGTGRRSQITLNLLNVEGDNDESGSH